MIEDDQPLRFTAQPVTAKTYYVWAVVILAAMGTVLVLAILWVRPTSDPLDVVAQVAKGLAPTIAGVMAYLKAQETHLSVNSRLDAFMKANAAAARSEGQMQGVAHEQARQAALQHSDTTNAVDSTVTFK